MTGNSPDSHSAQPVAFMIDGQEGDYNFLMAARTAGDGLPSRERSPFFFHAPRLLQPVSGITSSVAVPLLPLFRSKPWRLLCLITNRRTCSSPHNASGQRPGTVPLLFVLLPKLSASAGAKLPSLTESYLITTAIHLADAKKSRPDPADPAKLFLVLRATKDPSSFSIWAGVR